MTVEQFQGVVLQELGVENPDLLRGIYRQFWQGLERLKAFTPNLSDEQLEDLREQLRDLMPPPLAGSG